MGLHYTIWLNTADGLSYVIYNDVAFPKHLLTSFYFLVPPFFFFLNIFYDELLGDFERYSRAGGVSTHQVNNNKHPNIRQTTAISAFQIQGSNRESFSNEKKAKNRARICVCVCVCVSSSTRYNTVSSKQVDR